MKKLQIALAILCIITSIYTIVTSIMYLNKMIDNLGICMIGLLFSCVLSCSSCIVSVLNMKKKK